MSISTHLRMAIIIVLMSVLAAGGYLLRPRLESSLPPFPELATTDFAPVIQAHIQTTYQTTLATPENPQANGELGKVLHSYGQYASAAVCYRRAHLLAPDIFPWIYYVGYVLAEDGQYNDAIAALRQALVLRNYQPARLKLADTLLDVGKIQESAELYRSVLQQDPDIANAHYGLGRVSTALDKPLAAIQHYQQALALANNFGAAHYALALIYRDLGKGEAAQKHLILSQQHKQNKPSIQDHLMAAVAQLNVGARGHARKAKQLLARGKIRAATREFEKALAMDPDYVSVNVTLIYLYWQLGRIEAAKQRYHAAILADPNAVKAYINYGMLMGGQKDYDSALKAFEHAIQINPYNALAHGFLGFVLEELGRNDAAISHYQKALDNDPGQRRANFLLGRQRLLQGKTKIAANYFQKALAEPNTKNLWFLHNIGKAYGKAGQREQAVAYLEKAQHLAILQKSRRLTSIENDLMQAQQTVESE